jgi:L-rhamnose mutarotase
MDHVLFVAKIAESEKARYIEHHKRMSARFLKEKKVFGELREFIWLHGDLAIVYLMVENYQSFMEKSVKTKVYQEWVEKFKPIVVSAWEQPEMIYNFEKQFVQSLEKEIQ